MALRIAVGLFAAFRAVLIYGEAAQLASRPLDPPRLTLPQRLRRRPVVLDGRVLS
jgi:hypothetical protein